MNIHVYGLAWSTVMSNYNYKIHGKPTSSRLRAQPMQMKITF